MSTDDRAEGALEAAAKVLAEAVRNGATLGTPEIVAIMLRHRLRGPEPRVSMTNTQDEYAAVMHERARTPEESHEH